MKYLFFLIILCLPLVQGIGLSSPVVQMNHEPGSVETISHRISNQKDTDAEIFVNFSGELAPYVEPKEFHLHVGPHGSGTITYTFTHPSGLKPGWHYGAIIVTDMTRMGGGMFGVRVGVEGKLKLFVPYPERYADVSLSVPSINEGYDIEYSVAITNMGEEDIADSHLSVSFLYDGKVMKEVRHDDISLERYGSHVAEGWFRSEGFQKGIYQAQAVYDYGKIERVEQEFRVGSFEVVITNHTTTLREGLITPFRTTVQSNWNSQINEVYAVISIGSRSYRSVPVNLDPFGSADLVSYIDDTSFVAGDKVLANISVYYAEKTNSMVAQLDVAKEPAPESPQALADSAKSDSILKSPTLYLGMIVVLLILINVRLLFRRK